MDFLNVAQVNGAFPQALAEVVPKRAGTCCSLLYVMRGALLIRAHDAIAEAAAGTLVFFPDGFSNGHRLSGTAQAEVLDIDIDTAPAWTRKEIAPLRGENACCWHAHLEAAQQTRWEARFQYLHHARTVATKDAVLGALRDVRAALSSAHTESESLGAAVLDLLYEQYRDPDLSLGRIAERVGYSPAYLTDRVKRETGLPVHRWLLYYRIVEAKHLLRDTELTVEQVAQSVGFSSGNTFSRQFAKEAGQAPAAWRSAQQRSLRLPDATRMLQSAQTSWGLQLENVVDYLPHIAWVKDAAGALIFANKRWFDYSGMTEEESSGWGWTAIVHPDDVASVVGEWRNALRSRAPVEFVARIRRHADARYRTHLFRAVPFKAERGGLFWIGTATDLEDRLPGIHPRAE